MSKRRRSVTSDFRDDESAASSSAAVAAAKKRKRSVTQTVDQADICQELYDTIRNYKDDDGRLLCESFVRVPKRRSLPDYYDVVTTPIDLLKVQQKLKMDEYETIDQLTHDVELMVNNTKAYFKKETQEYQDACDLWDLYVETKNEILEENEELSGGVAGDWESDEETQAKKEPEKTEKPLSSNQVPPESGHSTESSDEPSASSSATITTTTTSTASATSAHEAKAVSEVQDISSVSEAKPEAVLAKPVIATSTDVGNSASEKNTGTSLTESMDTGQGMMQKEIPQKTAAKDMVSEVVSEGSGKSQIKMDIREKFKDVELSNSGEMLEDPITVSGTSHDSSLPMEVSEDTVKEEANTESKKSANTEGALSAVEKPNSEQKKKTVGEVTRGFPRAAKSSHPEEQEGSSRKEEKHTVIKDSVNNGFASEYSEEHKADSGQESDYAMDNPDNPYEQLFTSVMTHKNNEGRYTSLLFRKLPARSAYPEYYDVINNPIDMKIIAKKIKNEQYSSLHGLEKDLLLMVKNAKTFNEPGSQVYKDACTLKKIINGKKAELERMAKDGQIPSKSSERLKARQSTGQNSLSAITAALQISSDEEEDIPYPFKTIEYEEGEESGTDSFLADVGDPLHVLFEAVVSFKNAMGQLVAEPFMRLPNSRAYPDYYEEIKHPMALSKIRTKLKSGKYNSLDELEEDLNLVFNNALHYNMPNSRLYKDAERLQKLMQAKKKELEKFEVKKEEENTVEEEVEEKVKKKKAMSPIASSTDEKKVKRQDSSDTDSQLKKRMMLLYKIIEDYQDENGRYLTDLFMEKPSKKLYPDYYKVISEPIDMITIENNIISDKYTVEQALLADFKLMFNNARHYNEEESQVYRDADTLENLLLTKHKELGPVPAEVAPAPKAKALKKITPKKSTKALTPLAQKLKELYETVSNYKDSHKRVLSTIFQRLPSKSEYPEYYQVIKKPIDMQKIYQRIQCNQYETLDDMVADFLLMFDNACKFNEPDSQIYKDALTLQRILLQKNAELMSDESSGVPDVQMLVREIMTNLYVSVVNHQDEEGRCYSDSLAEIPIEKEEGTDMKRPLDLDVVRRNLDRGRYRRLDRFQDDMFEVFETARKLSRTDSQVYEDAMELQKFLITIRDEICKNGELLLSPALSYTHKHLQNDLDKEKKEKLPKEMKEDQEKREEEKRLQELEAEKEEEQASLATDGVDVKGQTYRVGDFVFLEPLLTNFCHLELNREKNLKPHIVLIEKLWTDDNGEQWLHGNWFYRPDETFHLATRKFLTKEVFKSDYYNSAKVSRVMGKCYVMFVKDYFKTKPEGYAEEDVYVCESRYNAKAKCFKKIKIWSLPSNSTKIVPRDEPLSRVRVASVFADHINKQEEPMETDAMDVLDKEREDIEVEVTNPDDGCTYYEQLNIESGYYKLGDCVYLRSDEDKPYLARIDKMWKDSNGDPWFHGPWYVHPSETEHQPTRMFYKNEVFLSSIEDTNPMRSISGKCAVFAFKDYISSRPTEISEDDVFVCEARYNEAERQIRKLKGLKKFSLANKVIDDEIYFFRKPITPLKEPSPLLQKVSEEQEVETEDKVEEEDTTSEVVPPPPPVVETPVKPKPKRTASGYILFASEIRSQLKQQYPDHSFGELSRVIGTEWRNLEAKQKSAYEERAALQAAAKEEAARNESSMTPGSPASQSAPPAGTLVVYECGWADCDFQYEDLQDLTNHILENSGHLRMLGDNPEYPCMWRGCPRNRKVSQPFPQMARLIRHCKEVHLRVAAKHIYPNQRSRNFFSRQAIRGGLQSASPGPGGRPMTPGSSTGAMMGIVGPPTPVGMQSGMHPGMQGGMQPGISMQASMPGMMPGHQGVPTVSTAMQGMQGVPPHSQPQAMSHGMSPMPNMGNHMGNQGLQMHPGMSPQTAPQGMPVRMGQPMMPQTMVPPHPPMMSPRGHPPPAPSPHSAHSGPASPAFDQGGHPVSQSPMPQSTVMQAQHTQITAAPPQPPAPMFVAVPPKTQRLLHSEAYLRYIEGLRSSHKTVSEWDRNLNAKRQDIPLSHQQKAKLPVHWLANGAGPCGDATKALWTLRDLMLQDSLRLSRSYNINLQSS
ncbi:protein polybromo-1-like isoform X3 [Ptychodera flava]|uniref:protein polybromo-1-like isoform X3 n=1 Tax=Ptychodera flava TaxID=63121 RepID=UPI00396A5849